ncbi:MAG: DUF2188 domain-containing protein [Ferruginibacter sp.]
MAKRSIYTRRLGEVVAEGAQTASIGKYHVISGKSQNWTVVPAGRVRPIKVFATQHAAVSFAKKYASKLTGMVIIHDKTGQTRDTISYAVA